jgi:hypothetical protein
MVVPGYTGGKGRDVGGGGGGGGWGGGISSVMVAREPLLDGDEVVECNSTGWGIFFSSSWIEGSFVVSDVRREEGGEEYSSSTMVEEARGTSATRTTTIRYQMIYYRHSQRRSCWQSLKPRY